MFKLNVSKEQLDGLLALVDMNLKVNGLSGLNKSVDLFNLLNSAQPVLQENDEPKDK